jgi:scyllo-inositol 2-dehydrogenase (NADP+)
MLREGAEAVDYFNVQLNYPNLHVNLSSSPYVPDTSQRFNIQGTQAQFVKQGKDPQEKQLNDGVLPSTVGFGCESANQFGILSNQTQQQVISSEVGNYGCYYQQLALAVNQQFSPPVPITEALSVMRILELAVLSSEQGRTINL